jgi:hypothetical protein
VRLTLGNSAVEAMTVPESPYSACMRPCVDEGCRVTSSGSAPSISATSSRACPIRSPTSAREDGRPLPSRSASAKISSRTDGDSGPNAAQFRYPGSLSKVAR